MHEEHPLFQAPANKCESDDTRTSGILHKQEPRREWKGRLFSRTDG